MSAKTQIEKQNAAIEALKYVKNGMTVGLGTGSTASIFVKLLAKKIKQEKLKIVGVCTSNDTLKLAKKNGITVEELNNVKSIDLAVDGCDEVDSKKNLTKGHGGALTWEKCIEYRAKKFVVIADSSKVFKKLGHRYLALEVLPLCWTHVKSELEEIGGKVKKRNNFTTDSGNYLLEWHCGIIHNPKTMESKLNLIPGVVENGIFAKKKPIIIIGKQKGSKKL